MNLNDLIMKKRNLQDDLDELMEREATGERVTLEIDNVNMRIAEVDDEIAEYD